MRRNLRRRRRRGVRLHTSVIRPVQGLWNQATITPLQRLTGRLGERSTDDEDAQEILDDISRNCRDGGGRGRCRPRLQRFLMDHGTIVPDRRERHSSSIRRTGRIPPVTPDLQKRMAAGQTPGSFRGRLAMGSGRRKPGVSLYRPARPAAISPGCLHEQLSDFPES
jgi:hypothetical protein